MKLILITALTVNLLASPLASAATPDAASATDSSVASPSNTTAMPTADTIVARGKGFVIMQREIDQVLATAKAQDPQHELPPDAELHVISQLIEIQLVLQKATDEEKVAGTKNAEEKVAGIMKTLGPVEFDHRLKTTLMTADDLRLKFAEDDTAQTSLTRQLGINVTDADAKKFFDEHPGAYDQPVLGRVREILLLTTSDFTTSAAPPLPPATIQAKRTLIDELLKRVRAGEDFAALAKQYNEDPISKDSGGELTFKREQMEFGDLAFSMKPNQISDVVTNDEGFRIIQLLEIIPAKKAVFADLDDRLKTMLTGKEKRLLAPAYITQLRKAADVEILDPKLKEAMAAADAQAAETAKAQAEYDARQAAAVKAAASTPIAKP